MKSNGFINFRIIALVIALLARIPFVGDFIFYGRSVEMLNGSVVVSAPQERADGAGADFTIENDSGKIACSLSFCGKEGWRLQTEYNEKISDYGAAQLLSYYLGEENPCKTEKITFSANSDAALLKASDGSSAQINFEPFGIVYKSPSGSVSAEVTDIAVNNGNTVVRGKLKSKEAMWGSGEHFDKINQRGEHIEINAIDEWAMIKRNSYMPIPILVSSRGSGLFMNRFERMTIDVDSRIVPKNTWQFCVLDAPCDLFVYTTEKPADVLYGYSLLTGFSPEPAEWTYGTIVCRYAPDFCTVGGVLDMAKAMEENDFPWEGVIVEGFNTADENGLKEVTEAVHALGKKLMVYTATGGNIFGASGDESGYLVRRALNNSVDLIPANSDNQEDNPNVSYWRYFDVTSKRTRDYLFGEKWGNAVSKYGVDGSKVDFCELFPDTYDLIFEDGITSGAHHWYPVVFNTMLYNTLNKNPGGTMTINRGGSTGAQRYPWIWMGDQKREFRFIAAQLKGVISSGISGIPFTTFDMAGYKDPAKDEVDVFRRAVEFTAFIGNIQTHGTVKRPYDYDEETRAIYRKFSKIHDALRPYLIETGKTACETGLPLVRHLAINYCSDEKVWDIEDEFMLGDRLLVAPILDGGHYRSIYLPEGEWENLWTGEKYEGGKSLLMYHVEDDEIPVFVNTAVSSEAFESCKEEIIGLYSDKN